MPSGLSFLCFPLSFAPFVCSHCQFNDCLGLDLFLASLTRSFRCFVSSLLKFDVLVLKCDLLPGCHCISVYVFPAAIRPSRHCLCIDLCYFLMLHSF